MTKRRPFYSDPSSCRLGGMNCFLLIEGGGEEAACVGGKRRRKNPPTDPKAPGKKKESQHAAESALRSEKRSSRRICRTAIPDYSFRSRSQRGHLDLVPKEKDRSLV